MSKNILRNKVLVLNKHWTPIGTCTVRRALSLMTTLTYEGKFKAEAIDYDLNVHAWDSWIKLPAEEKNCIHSPSWCIRAPEAIVTRCNILPRLNPNFSKRGILRRDCFQCQYCGIKSQSYKCTVDHVIPKSRGGKNTWTNCVTACEKCNLKKANFLLEETNMQLIKIPCRPPILTFDGEIKDLWLKLGFNH